MISGMLPELVTGLFDFCTLKAYDPQLAVHVRHACSTRSRRWRRRLAFRPALVPVGRGKTRSGK